MKNRSEREVREEASRGKNEPMAKTPKVATNQNGEARPPKDAAEAQPGTDESKETPG